MNNKALNYLALAKKGRLAELGEEPVGAIARTGIAYAILVAGDASDHTWRRAKSYAAGTDQQCVRLPYTKDEMGFVIGRTSLAIGKEGQNARLAARLTGYKIDITPASQAEPEAEAAEEAELNEE